MIPHSSLYFLYVCGFIIGIGGGSWDSTFNVWIIEIWQQNNGPILQLSQFAYGIGSIIGPLIDKPFIVGDDNQHPDPNIKRDALLNTPFAIIGGIQLLGALFMSVMFYIRKYEIPEENEENWKQIKTDGRVKLRGDSGAPIKTIVMLCAICFASFTAIENCQFQFSPTFNQYIPLRLCAPKTAIILSVMALCFTLGRGISIFIAIRLRPETMITYHYCIIITAIIVLLFAQNSLLFICIGNILIGMTLTSTSDIKSDFFSSLSRYRTVSDVGPHVVIHRPISGDNRKDWFDSHLFVRHSVDNFSASDRTLHSKPTNGFDLF